MISVIIPVYNQAAKLKACLDSIAKQTETNYEVIVVNDGSTDNPEAVFKAAQFNKPAKFISQTNQGANVARNRGAGEAQGDYLLFCDADLTLDERMLEYLYEALQENPSAAYAYSSFQYGPKVFRLWPFDADKLKQMPYIHTSALIRAQDFPGFDEKIKRFQDWDLWLTLLENGKMGFWVDKVLFRAQGGGTISSWLPGFAYKLLPWLKAVKEYDKAKEIIQKKHKFKI